MNNVTKPAFVNSQMLQFVTGYLVTEARVSQAEAKTRATSWLRENPNVSAADVRRTAIKDIE